MAVGGSKEAEGHLQDSTLSHLASRDAWISVERYATSTPHRFFSCSDLRLIYGPSNELTEEYLTSS
ncbi:hypothetical protein, partial [Sinorhizobium meliloti]|uniref:hypothetical protein n=1 Tax=Rhizobium meliloti TaxID=382 RepID=UPI001AEC8EA5